MREWLKNILSGNQTASPGQDDDAVTSGMDSDMEADRAAAESLWDFREKPASRLAPMPATLGIWELAWPTILAALMHTVVRWVDIKMVGDLGMEAVAGVTAGGQIYWVIQAVAMALTMGTVALVSRAIGAKDMSLADRVLRQSIIMGTLFGLVSWLAFLPWLTPAIALLGMEKTVVDIGADYTFWLLAGNIPFTLAFVFGAALRSAGDSRTPLYVGVVSNLFNIFLNWVLIYGNLGFPAMGVAGAGIASSVAMFVQLVVFLYMWRTGKLAIKPKSLSFKFEFDVWKRILKIGYPSSIEGFLFQGGLLAFMSLMATFGTAEFTAYQVGIQVLALAFLPGHGFATASSTLVGQNLGAEDPDAAAAAGWRSMFMAMGVMGVMGALMIAISEPFARWFVDNDEVVALSVQFIWLLGMAQPMMAIENAIGGGLRGAGDTRFPLLTVFCGLFFCRVIPAYIAVYVFDAGIQVVWSFLLLDYLLKASMMIWRFRQGRWKTIKV